MKHLKCNLSLAFLSFLFLTVVHAQTGKGKNEKSDITAVSKEELFQSIQMDKLQHPYLLFTNEDKQALIERIKTDRDCKMVMDGLIAEGHRYLYVPIQNPPPQEPEHPRYATDGLAVKYRSEIVDGALTLSFLYQMTGDMKYVKKAKEFAFAICDLPIWINAAHKFDIIYPRVWPYNVPDDQVVFSYDITAARVAANLAITYDWLYPVLTREERDKIRNGLLEKAITRVRGNYEFFWWSTAYRCNWSAICYSGLGISSLALLKENPQLIDVVSESYNRIALTLNEIGDDGGWQEGRGYYAFMLHHSVYFIDMLKKISKGKYNLFKHPKVSKKPFDFELYGLTANFGDGGGGPIGPKYLVNKLVEETNNAAAAWYGENILTQREHYSIWDIIWPKSNVKPVEPAQKSMHFSSIDWVVMRSSFTDSSKVTIACKAGMNDDPHHGHLDCGHFNLTWNNEMFFKDLGGMKYDEYYFNNDRWEYPFASSTGHNVVLVNDEQQICAKSKNEPWKEGIGGKVLVFKTTDKQDYVLMDPTRAYPNKELKKWRRSIILEKPLITVVLDEIGANQGSELKARFYTGVTSNVQPNFVFMKGKKGNMALIPLAADNSLSLNEGKHPYIPVKEEGIMTWIPYFETVTKAKVNTSVIASIIVPVNDIADAERIQRSAKLIQVNPGQLEVSIDMDSKHYSWSFENKGEGFVLK